MPVPSNLTDLSPVAGLNFPLGGEDVFPQLDNYLRAHAAFIAQLRQSQIAAETTKYQLACSDLTSDLAVNDEAAYFRTQRELVVSTVRASVIDASTVGPVSVMITVNGVDLLSTALTIDQDETSSTTAAVPHVLAFDTIPDDALVLVKIVSPGVGAKGLIVALQGVSN